jgi:hypothetical protein
MNLNITDSELLGHLNKVWPDNEKEVFTWELGKIKDILPNFTVIRVAPRSQDEPWIYISNGAWAVDTNKDYRQEFFLMCPFENPRHVETLAMLASYYADSEHDLNIGNSVNTGRGWLEGSNYDRLLISLPYPYGPDLEICILKDATVKYLWLLPINTAEHEYLCTNGLEALEQKFDEAEIDFLNPDRPPVI